MNVGESKITPFSKVRDLGLIFDQFLNFDDHITSICRSTHFHIRSKGILYRMMLVPLFMHLLVVKNKNN